MTDRSKPQYQKASIMAALLGTMLWASPAYATTWYVRKSGSNSNSGTSPSSAYLTISKAEDMVIAGDTVYVGAGTYAENVKIQRSGSSGAYISFIADSTGTYTGDAGDVIIDGTNSRNRGIESKDRSYLRIVGFHVKRTKKYGIKVEKADHVAVESCRIYDNQERGIEFKKAYSCDITDCHVYSNGKTGIKLEAEKERPGSTITRCLVYGNGEEGIKVKLAEDTTADVVNCLCYANTKDGIEVEGNDHGSASIYNNTLVGNQEKGIEIKHGSVTLRNNIIAFNKDLGLKKNSGSCSSDYNLFWGNKESLAENWSNQIDGTSRGAHDFMGDPLLEDRGGNDYHLTASSPARNAGTPSGAPSVDYENSDRKSADGYVDVGADEWGVVLRVISWREVRR